MIRIDPRSSASLGADLRALRKSRGITLAQLAQRLDRSVGWISQVERDLSEPSMADLRALADALGFPLSMLFGQASGPAEEAGVIVRRDARRKLGGGAAGLTEELLSPDLTDDFEMLHSTFAPGSDSGRVAPRPTQEVGYVIAGRLALTIGGTEFEVGPGDSFRIKGATFLWRNPHDEPAQVIWVIAPPVY